MVVLVVERHADGKLYPERWWDLPAATVERVRGLEHALRCGQGLSYREVQRVLLERYGERRSLGVIFKDIRRYECGHCVPELTPPPPDPAQRPRAFQWR
jgi:hypothetical protein